MIVFTKKVSISIGLAALLVIVGVSSFFIFSKKSPIADEVAEIIPGVGSSSDAIKAGKKLSNNRCEGEGVPYKLSRSPMDPEDFGIVIPYGLMVGGHVTPIDHQYFSPKDRNSPENAYEVYAMADSTIVDIGERPSQFGNKEYRLVFTITCTYFYYYDLVTALSPEIKAIYDGSIGGQFRKPIEISVKAGQMIGRIGGQTLDFAVWDTTKPLEAFVNPDSYEAENWKIYTADPLNYYTDELKSLILSRYVRTAEPISGKIDYDIDGKLIGNWFEEGTNGYGGPPREGGGGYEGYWEGHLAIAPDHYDPTAYIISIGYLDTSGSGSNQFSAPRTSPDPANVGVDTGLVKYELKTWSYRKADGSFWDRMSLTSGVTLDNQANAQMRGCALAQMLETRKLKFEAIPSKLCADVSGFSPSARVYVR